MLGSSAGNISTLFLSFGFFLVVYCIAYFKLFRNWSRSQRAEATSCVISLVHGTPVAILSAYCLVKSGSPFQSLHRKNTPLENRVFEFSLAYFLVDLPHFLIFFPDDIKFIAHHVATLYVMGSCRFYVGHGACTILSILLLAEITSPIQNSWNLAALTRLQSPTSARIYSLLSPFFYFFYTVSRSILAPMLNYHLAVYYSTGIADNVIPRWLAYSWVVILALALLGSFSWVLSLWIELFRSYCKRIKVGEGSVKTE